MRLYHSLTVHSLKAEYSIYKKKQNPLFLTDSAYNIGLYNCYVASANNRRRTKLARKNHIVLQFIL